MGTDVKVRCGGLALHTSSEEVGEAWRLLSCVVASQLVLHTQHCHGGHLKASRAAINYGERPEQVETAGANQPVAKENGSTLAMALGGYLFFSLGSTHCFTPS